MKNRVHLYILLVISVLVQVVLMKHAVWVPDIILIMVVFAGIFLGVAEGLGFGLAAGFLRGCFSVQTFPLDIFLFPIIGLISAMLARMFYRQNPAAQVFITMVALAVVVTAHTLYLNAVACNDVGLGHVFLMSWRPFLVTVLVSPPAFLALQKVGSVKSKIKNQKHI